MSDLQRVDLENQNLVCMGCGVKQHFEPGPTLEFLETMDKFNADHANCEAPKYDFNFAPGDKVEFCGIQASVVKNYGNQGIVEIPGEGHCVWHWLFAGEPVKRVQQ